MSDVPIDATQPPSGVDLAQIDAMLALTPLERLALAEEWANGVLYLRALNPRLALGALADCER